MGSVPRSAGREISGIAVAVFGMAAFHKLQMLCSRHLYGGNPASKTITEDRDEE